MSEQVWENGVLSDCGRMNDVQLVKMARRVLNVIRIDGVKARACQSTSTRRPFGQSATFAHLDPSRGREKSFRQLPSLRRVRG